MTNYKENITSFTDHFAFQQILYPKQTTQNKENEPRNDYGHDRQKTSLLTAT